MFAQKVSILGTDYSICIKKYSEDDAFERLSIDGYCNGFTRQIVCCDISTCKGWEHETRGAIEAVQKEVLRHEIVHAFFHESSLADSSLNVDCAWAKNEEMVDWFALQGRKIYKAWKKAGCL